MESLTFFNNAACASWPKVMTIISTCSSSHLPILLVSSAKEPGTCGQTVPDYPLRRELWSDVLVWHNPLPRLQLLHTWIPPYPMLYLQQGKNRDLFWVTLLKVSPHSDTCLLLVNCELHFAEECMHCFQTHLLMGKFLCAHLTSVFTSATVSPLIDSLFFREGE